MITTLSGLATVRAYLNADTRYLLQILICSTSSVEATIALDLLSKNVPEQAIVSALNMREAIRAIPATPFRMAVDEDTLIRAGRLRKDLALLKRATPDGYVVAVTTSGNLVLDLIITHGDEKRFWTPVPLKRELCDPALISHLISSEHLFATVLEVVRAMGIVHNPTLYLSLSDWRCEHARDAVAYVDDVLP